MEAKIRRVIFEPKIVSALDVERKLKFIEKLPIIATSNNGPDLGKLEMEVFFIENGGASIYPIEIANVLYNGLDNVKDCNINANFTCVNILNHNAGVNVETYSFFYKKKESK